MRGIVYTVFFSFLVMLSFSSCSSDSNAIGSDGASYSDAQKTLRINIGKDPSTLDIRKARDTRTLNILNTLYEGLVRTTQDGSIELALAKDVKISKDRMKYTFTLRPALWSDGTPVTAYDFENTWKSLLSPSFPAESSELFFPIHAARSAKEDLTSLDNVGIHASSKDTLVISLDYPTPYFLSLLSHPIFFPIQSNILLSSSPWDSPNNTSYISNGPFTLDHWTPGNELVVKKNPHYWNKESVFLDSITMVMVDEPTELYLFDAESLDWAGSPISALPVDALEALKEAERLDVSPALGTQFFRFNVDTFPFSNKSLRKALCYAINRQNIVDHVTQGGQQPACGFLPPSVAIAEKPYFSDNDTAAAKAFFLQALEELKLSPEGLRDILESSSSAIMYTKNDRDHKIVQAIQQQWESVFDIKIPLQVQESKTYFSKRRSGSFTIANSSWIGDFSDPITFLDIFSDKNHAANYTRWEHPVYSRLIQKIKRSDVTPEERRQSILKAEEILLDEAPIIPLFYYSFCSVKHNKLHDVVISDTGIVDFSRAYFE
jgi:oligopeptide transport system substrate-binding protein